MFACIERLGAQSPAALMACDTYLARDFWSGYAHRHYAARGTSVWVYGDNDDGQLGLGTKIDPECVTEVETLRGTNIVGAAFGTTHTMLLADTGALWAAGENADGQLGLNDWRSWIPLISSIRDRTTFVQVTSLSRVFVTAIACGIAHTLALSNTGAVFAWGVGDHGQLGQGTWSDHSTPQEIKTLRGVTAIAAAYMHSCALTEDGTMYTWGLNNNGVLGLGLSAAHQMHMPDRVAGPLDGKRVVQMGCSNSVAVALLDTGGVCAWGLNHRGQLGVGVPMLFAIYPMTVPLDDKIEHVACNDAAIILVSRTNKVYVTGQMTRYLRDVPVPFSTRPLAMSLGAGTIASVAMGDGWLTITNDDGIVYAWGDKDGMIGERIGRMHATVKRFFCSPNTASCVIVK